MQVKLNTKLRMLSMFHHCVVVMFLVFVILDTHTQVDRPLVLLLCITASILEQMAAVRKRNESSVIDQIGDDLLSWVSTILRLKLYILFQTFSYIEYISR